MHGMITFLYANFSGELSVIPQQESDPSPYATLRKIWT